MSNLKSTPSAHQTKSFGNKEIDRMEAAVAAIEGMCGQIFCESYFIRLANLDAMAIACERYPKVYGWWETMIRLGHPEAPQVWAEIKARMDSRAAARVIEHAASIR